ncbi:beta-ketoacyl-ACP synthase II [soil metagenome]
MSRRRVVVTGLGTVNPIALSVPEYWRNLLAGVSGIAPLTLFDVSAFKTRFGGEVKNFTTEPLLDKRDTRRLDRFAQFAIVAAHEAITDSGIDLSKYDPFRTGCILGSGIGGLAEFEDGYNTFRDKGPSRIGPLVIPKMIANSASGNISIRWNLRGPNTTVSTACSSAAHAMGDAMHAIQYGFADVIVSGGTEAAITHMGLGGFCAARALSENNDDPTHASRPFDKKRDGFVLSEGAGIVIMEDYEHAKARGAKIYCEILGCGNTADAYHITAPHEDGVGAAAAMRAACHEAGWNLTDVQYLNAHGTSTPLGDMAETKAMKLAFGDHARKLMISSTKSMIGHLLGASGGVEAVACALMLQHGVIHPTIHLDEPDPDCDLDYVPNTPREVRVTKILSNSFGFGGHNCSLAIGAI